MYLHKNKLARLIFERIKDSEELSEFGIYLRDISENILEKEYEEEFSELREKFKRFRDLENNHELIYISYYDYNKLEYNLKFYFDQLESIKWNAIYYSYSDIKNLFNMIDPNTVLGETIFFILKRGIYRKIIVSDSYPSFENRKRINKNQFTVEEKMVIGRS